MTAPTPPALGHCASCSVTLDPQLHASCEVCDGVLLCLACAKRHLCSPQCAERGCLPGLCVKMIRDGRTSTTFGYLHAG